MKRILGAALGATIVLAASVLVAQGLPARPRVGGVEFVATASAPAAAGRPQVYVSSGDSKLHFKNAGGTDAALVTGSSVVNSLINGGGITASPASGNVTLGSSFGGDVAGSVASATVGGLQGRLVSNAAPSTNDVLTWGGAQWAPGVVGTLQGRTVSAAAPNTSDVLQWSGQWTPTAPSWVPTSNTLAPTGKTLTWSAVAQAGPPSIYIREYRTAYGWWRTTNASWSDGSGLWSKDDTAKDSIAWETAGANGNPYIGVHYRAAGAGTFNDAQFVANISMYGSAGQVYAGNYIGSAIQGTQTITTAAASGSTGGSAVSLGYGYKESPVLAEAIIEGAAGPSMTLKWGMNIDSVNTTYEAGSLYKITLQTGAPNYLVILPSVQTAGATIPTIYQATPPTTTVFRIKLFTTAGAAYSLAIGERLHVVVHGM